MTFWVAGAVVAGAAISAVSANSAAGKQQAAANQATATQQGMYNQTFAAGQPYRDSGALATGKLQDLMGLSGNSTSPGYGSLTQTFTPQDYLANQDPGYQFQLQQGQQALQNSQAAQGGVLSGAALKDLINFNQGTAATGYQNAFNRFQTQQNNTYSRLGNIATLGQNSAANAGSTGANFANGISGTITGAGNAAAAGQIGVGNAISSGINSGIGYYQLNQLMTPNAAASSPTAGSTSGLGAYPGGGT